MNTSLNVQLAGVWQEFEQRLLNVPIMQRLENGSPTLADYQQLLLNLRQQVVDGGRWLSLAASSMSQALLPMRSMFILHAAEEHRDFLMLEHDYCSVGGALEVIQNQSKNPGSEALSSYMFHQAAQPDPVHLLGAIFIIEGLGRRKANHWAARLQEALHLEPRQVSFLRHHGAHDDAHVEKVQALLSHPLLQGPAAQRLVMCARVTARLYVLQLEELTTT